jgi:methylenetetrahydrofolate reductase (NADPH)
MRVLPGALLADYSLDMSGKAAGELEGARGVIPPGTRVHIGFVASEDMAMRVEAARAIRKSGFKPVPIISARRMLSEEMLREFLAELRAADASQDVMVVGGDPDPPQGPYPDAFSVISSGLLEEYGVRRVSITGHPAGLPVATPDVLWQALAGKAAELRKRGLADRVVTQFGFDAGLILAWLAGLRARGVSMPAEVGVPGPSTRAASAVVRLTVRCQRERCCCPRIRAPGYRHRRHGRT